MGSLQQKDAAWNGERRPPIATTSQPDPDGTAGPPHNRRPRPRAGPEPAPSSPTSILKPRSASAAPTHPPARSPLPPAPFPAPHRLPSAGPGPAAPPAAAAAPCCPATPPCRTARPHCAGAARGLPGAVVPVRTTTPIMHRGSSVPVPSSPRAPPGGRGSGGATRRGGCGTGARQSAGRARNGEGPARFAHGVFPAPVMLLGEPGRDLGAVLGRLLCAAVRAHGETEP